MNIKMGEYYQSKWDKDFFIKIEYKIKNNNYYVHFFDNFKLADKRDISNVLCGVFIEHYYKPFPKLKAELMLKK